MSPADPAQFCDEVRDRLVGSLTLYCGDRGIGEELAQEALVRAWERWSSVSKMEHPEAWVFRTGTNLANSWLRRRGIERRANERAVTSTAASPSHGQDDLLDLRSAVASLPPRERATVIARFYLDLSVEDTAIALGCAQGTVKATTAHAIARLKSSASFNVEVLEAP